MNRYPCPNCRGVGYVSVAFSFPTTCAWCNGTCSLNAEQIERFKRARQLDRKPIFVPSPPPRPLIDERGA